MDYNDKFMPITLITVGTQAVPYNVISGKMAVGIAGHDYHYRTDWGALTSQHDMAQLQPLCHSVPPVGSLAGLDLISNVDYC